jgi:hypothetical protein
LFTNENAPEDEELRKFHTKNEDVSEYVTAKRGSCGESHIAEKRVGSFEVELNGHSREPGQLELRDIVLYSKTSAMPR